MYSCMMYSCMMYAIQRFCQRSNIINSFAPAAQEVSSLGQLSRYGYLLQTEKSGDRIPVGTRFSAPVHTGFGADPASCMMSTGSFSGVKWQGVALAIHPHVAPRLKKEQSYNCTPPLGHHGLLKGKIYFYFNFYPGGTGASEIPHASHQVGLMLWGGDHETSKTQTGSENRYEKRNVMTVETVGKLRVTDQMHIKIAARLQITINLTL